MARQVKRQVIRQVIRQAIRQAIRQVPWRAQLTSKQSVQQAELDWQSILRRGQLAGTACPGRTGATGFARPHSLARPHRRSWPGRIAWPDRTSAAGPAA